MSKLYDEIFKLKLQLRKGWLVRNVCCENRVESDAEHCYSMTMLALEIMSKEKLNLNQEKVLKMIAYHEIGEIDFGDHTPLDGISKEEKYNAELKCVERISNECDIPEMLEMWKEFEENSTPEARFVKKIDKLDCILQCKIYGDACNNEEICKEFESSHKDLIEEFKDYVKKNS